MGTPRSRRPLAHLLHEARWSRAHLFHAKLFHANLPLAHAASVGWQLIWKRTVGNQKDAVAGEFFYETLVVALRSLAVNVELRSRPVRHDFRQRCTAVGCLPDHGGHRIQGEEG